MMKLKTRNLLAGALIAGVATLGTGGAAFATQTPSPTSPSTSTANRDSRWCAREVPRLPSLDARRIRDEQRIDDLQQAIAVARAHHRDDLAARLERQLDQVQRDHAVLIVEIAAIHLRCHV